MAGRSSRSRSSSGSNGRSSGRSHSSATATPHNVQPAPAAPAPVTIAAPMQQPGFLSGIVQTAVGTTIGHTVGRAVTNMLGLNGTSYAAPEPAASSEPSPITATADKTTICEPHLKSFMTCMEKNNHDSSACQYYLDMLKSCRSEPSTPTASW